MAVYGFSAYSNDLMKGADLPCPGCASLGVSVFFESNRAPANPVLLTRSRKEALEHEMREVTLGFCGSCGLIHNFSFDPEGLEYSEDCESTQEFSLIYNTYARALALSLVKRYGLRDKDVLEIGCGKGDFLTLLCELGDNRGIGFDPSYAHGRAESRALDSITFIKDFYSPEYWSLKADLIVCRLTLDRVGQTAEFLRMLRRSIGNRTDTVFFFQVPDVMRTLKGLAFWDIHFGISTYFSAASLTRLMRDAGFEVLEVRKGFSGQQILLEARPSRGKTHRTAHEPGAGAMAGAVAYFAENHRQNLSLWRRRIDAMSLSGYRAVVWGSGYKAAGFLNSLGIRDEIRYAVDINPYKHGSYIPGAGQKIVGPAFLRNYRPDAVIVMNPVYREEIRNELKRMMVSAELVTL